MHLPQQSKVFYGPIKVRKLFGGICLIRHRTKTLETVSLAVGGRVCRILRRKLPMKFLAASIRNDAFDAGNLRELEKLRDGTIRVLFVVDNLAAAGGVERRLALQFAWLEKHGIDPIIVGETQDYAPLAKYPFLRFIDYAPNAEDKLLDFIRWTRASVVEFNMKNPKLMHEVDLSMLRRFVRTGCMIHGHIDADQARLDELDYRCTSNKHSNDFQGLIWIPNVVDFPEAACLPQYDAAASKALYVGRIDNEKLPTIRSFIRVCEHYGLDYKIAGPLKQTEETLQWARDLPPGILLGLVDTRSYLIENGGKYAFIGGVGQVPLEAAAAGLPTLVATHLDDAFRSAFMTAENAASLLDRNCVLRKQEDCDIPGNVESFFAARRRAVEEECSAPMAPFRIRTDLMKMRDAETVWQAYWRELMAGKIPEAESL